MRNNSTVRLSELKLPEDLKKLTVPQCKALCREIRSILINTVSENGGHLASNLGTVELTMAIHRVFDSPKDKIIWDVGASGIYSQAADRAAGQVFHPQNGKRHIGVCKAFRVRA